MRGIQLCFLWSGLMSGAVLPPNGHPSHLTKYSLFMLNHLFSLLLCSLSAFSFCTSVAFSWKLCFDLFDSLSKTIFKGIYTCIYISLFNQWICLCVFLKMFFFFQDLINFHDFSKSRNHISKWGFLVYPKIYFPRPYESKDKISYWGGALKYISSVLAVLVHLKLVWSYFQCFGVILRSPGWETLI